VGTDVIISPDGTRVVFASRGSDGVTRLNTRALDQAQVTELPDTEGATGPFFSPDGRWVGFRASGQLKKISIDGGLPVVLCDAPDLLGASWGEDGSIIAALIRGRLWRVAPSRGQPTAVLDLAAESRYPVWPQILPGGKWLLFTTIGSTGANGAHIEAFSLVDGRRKVLMRGGTFGRYVNGYLLYVNQGTLFAMALDPDRMVPLGSVNAVVKDVAYSPTFGFAQLDTSRTGTLVYRRNDAGGEFLAEWLDASGKAEPLSMKPGNYAWPRVSPDGQRVAFSAVESGTTTTLVYNTQTSRIARAGSTAEGYVAPLWTPDGSGLILGGAKGMAWLSADDLQSLLPLTLNTGIQIPWSFAPDRTRLAYYNYELNSPTAFDLWTIPIHWVEGHTTVGAPEPYLRTVSIETYPSFSPDGRWLAYTSSESGTQELYVRPFPDSGTKVRISDAGGLIPIWSPNGRELFYRTPDQRIMVTEYAVTDGLFVASKSKVWSDKRLGDTGVLPNFDLSPDGKHILALMPAAKPQDQQAQNHVTFVLNFIGEVRRQVSSHVK
jgi:Tol biopolymer transport system component